MTREKVAFVAAIIGSIVASLGIFLMVNNVFALVAHAEEYAAMNNSSFWYWLFYKLPGDNAAYVASAEAPAGSAHSIPALLYHGEGATSNMPLSVFVAQLRALKAAGWHTITLQQFEGFVQNGTPVPDKSFLLTFDDGRKDTYYQADPVLKDLGFNAVMFVITGFSMPISGKQPSFYLNRTELADMAASGHWQLESHGDNDHATYAVQSTTDLSAAASTTSGHFLSNKFWDPGTNQFETNAAFQTRITNDLTSAKQTLEQDFHIQVNAFAYPFNDFGQDTVNFQGSQAIVDRVVPQLYQFAFYQTWPENGDTFNYPGVNNGPGTTPYMVKRIEPNGTMTGDDLMAIMNAGEAKPLPYASTQFGQEWVGTWGSTHIHGNTLELHAAPQTSGASAFLNGSGWWTNYLASMRVSPGAGTVSVLARNRDDSHYLSCTFGSTGVVLEWRDGSTDDSLASSDSAKLPSSGAITLGIAVYGNRATCYQAGSPVISAIAPQAERSGGIGVEVWDPALGVAHTIVSSISVRQLVAPPPAPAAPGIPQSAAAAQQPAIPNTGTLPFQTTPILESVQVNSSPASPISPPPSPVIATPTPIMEAHSSVAATTTPERFFQQSTNQDATTTKHRHTNRGD